MEVISQTHPTDNKPKPDCHSDETGSFVNVDFSSVFDDSVDFNTELYSDDLESFGSSKHEDSFCTSDRDDSEFLADSSGDSLPNVKGRSQERLPFWKEIGAGNWVTRILRAGYALSFTKEPQPASFNNNRSALNNREFVTKEILDLLSSGRIREVDIFEVHTINPLTVADNGEKLRQILDLRHINQYLQVPKFKCDDIRQVKQLFNGGDFFFKFDIQSGYYHIDIHPAYHKILAFKWSINGQMRYFVFTVSAFGLSSAHSVITQVLKALIKHWRSFGILIFAFIDDGFGGGNSLEEATRCLSIVQSDLAKSGFIAHPTKSQWIPKQEGFIVNLKDGVLQFQLEDCWFYRKSYGDLHREETHSQNTGQFSWYNNFHGLSLRPRKSVCQLKLRMR